jgi:hypothetical protein
MAESKSKAKGWRIVCFDTEVVPDEPPTRLRNGFIVADANKRVMLQYAFSDLAGEMIVPDTNLNPQINWANVPDFKGYAAKCWGVKPEDVLNEAECLPTFAQSFMASISTLRSQMGKKLIVAAHNGHAWDFVILLKQMKQAGFKFPRDMEIIALDTKSLVQWLLRLIDDKDRKWSLGYAYEKFFEEKIKNQHTASADCMALARILGRYCRDMDLDNESQLIAHLFKAAGKGLACDTFAELQHGKVKLEAKKLDPPGGLPLAAAPVVTEKMARKAYSKCQLECTFPLPHICGRFHDDKEDKPRLEYAFCFACDKWLNGKVHYSEEHMVCIECLPSSKAAAAIATFDPLLKDSVEETAKELDKLSLKERKKLILALS